MSAVDFSEALAKNDDDLNQILEDIGVENTYLDNVLTQNVTATEYVSPKEEYFILPKGAKEIKFENIKTTKKRRPLLTIALAILTLNALEDLNTWPEIKFFTMAILLVAVTSGCLKKQKNFKEEDFKEDNNVFTEKADDIKKILGYIPNAKNFIALSVINFIRFNHHYPREKESIIKKGFLGLPENDVSDFLNANGKNLKLFFSYPFQACKLVSEYAYFYKYINTNIKIDDEDVTEQTYLTLGYIQDCICNDTIITLRNEPTTNGFLILDLLFVLVNFLNSHHLLGFITDKESVKGLLEKRKFLKAHPFRYHPSRFFNKIKFQKDNYNNFVSEFQEEIKKIGNFIYLFCMEEGGTLQEAKSVLKFQYTEIGEYADLYEIYKLIKEEKSLLDPETKNKIKSIIKPKIKIPETSEDLEKMNEEAKNVIFG